MKGLTKRQRDVLDVITRTTKEQGYPPSFREIAAQLNLASAAGVHKHVKALVKKGYLLKQDHLSRSLRSLDESEGAQAPVEALSELPLLGYVAAGHPIEAISQNEEALLLPSAFLIPGKRYFVLRVRGDSMVEEGILDGDYVILEKREEANNGEVVVALINGLEATLKRFFHQQGTVRLQPANPAMEPIIVKDWELRVQGVVVGVWRRY